MKRGTGVVEDEDELEARKRLGNEWDADEVGGKLRVGRNE